MHELFDKGIPLFLRENKQTPIKSAGYDSRPFKLRTKLGRNSHSALRIDVMVKFSQEHGFMRSFLLNLLTYPPLWGFIHTVVHNSPLLNHYCADLQLMQKAASRRALKKAPFMGLF
jgi:hypothetical protein